MIWSNGTCLNKPFKCGIHRKLVCGNTKIQTEYSTLNVTTASWGIRITPKHVFDRLNGPKRRIDLRLQRYTTAAAHGLLGQGYSRNVENGKLDTYPFEGEFTTSAMGEGAIEGTEPEYSVSQPYDTAFKYSKYTMLEEGVATFQVSTAE